MLKDVCVLRGLQAGEPLTSEQSALQAFWKKKNERYKTNAWLTLIFNVENVTFKIFNYSHDIYDRECFPP